MASTADPASGGARPVAVACVLVGLLVAVWTMVAIPARATYGARLTADEPQYLLSALSLAEDRDLWVDDELAAERYRPFHEVRLPVQTEQLANGREASPHDPLLPVLLSIPMGLGGWAMAKGTLALLAGALATALVWVAHRRFRVRLAVSTGTVLAFGLTAPLSAYATQVYPELPAALAVTVAIAVLTSPRPPTRGGILLLGLALVALPWLGVKYLLVSAALAVVGIVWLAPRSNDGILGTPTRAPVRVGVPRTGAGGWRLAVGFVGGLAAGAVVYLAAHRLLYGGWTVYAAGDHFVEGELTVVGHDPNYLGRSRRVLGLLLDEGFGLAAWMPGYLLMVPAGAALLRRRPAGWLVLAAPLAAGWATATWIALTMHGWWWPGRQVVVVLPCVVLAVAWWVDRVSVARPVLAVAAALGVGSWTYLLVEVFQGERTLIVDFYETSNPLYRAWSAVLPDYRHPGTGDWLLQGVWVVTLGLLAVWAIRTEATRPSNDAQEVAGRTPPSEVAPETAPEIEMTKTRRSTHVSA